MRGAYRPDGVTSRGRLTEPLDEPLSTSIPRSCYVPARMRPRRARRYDRARNGSRVAPSPSPESEAIMRRTHREAIARSVIRIATILLAELGAVVATTGIVLAQRPAPVSKPVAIR